MNSKMKHLLTWPLRYPVLRNVRSNLFPLKKLCCLSLIDLEALLCVLDLSPLLDILTSDSFSYSVTCPFSSLVKFNVI